MYLFSSQGETVGVLVPISFIIKSGRGDQCHLEEAFIHATAKSHSSHQTLLSHTNFLNKQYRIYVKVLI